MSLLVRLGPRALVVSHEERGLPAAEEAMDVFATHVGHVSCCSVGRLCGVVGD